MAETLGGGMSLALTGFGYWAHDIGGFEGKPDPALFKRWIAFGLFSSHSTLHGSASFRVYSYENLPLKSCLTKANRCPG
jgi:alpha-D-xyloside xylohydrolase